MNKNEKHNVRFINFLIFVFCNYLSISKKIKSVDSEIVYYNSATKDFYQMKVISRVISIALLVLIGIFTNISFVNINLDINLKEYAEVLLTYCILLVTCVLIILLGYSLKYKDFEYKPIEKNEDKPDKYNFALYIFNTHSPFVLFRFNTNVASIKSRYYFKYSYINKLKFDILYLLLILLIYSVVFLPDALNHIVSSLIVENNYLKNRVILIALFHTIILVLSYFEIWKYELVKFIKGK